MKSVSDLLIEVKDLFSKQQYQAIIDLLPDSLLEEYNDAALYSWPAAAYNKLKDYDRTLFYANMVNRVNPESAYGFFFRGLAYNGKGRFDEAVKEFTKAIISNNENADFFRYRGIAYSSLEDYENAIKDFSEAIKINGKDGYAFFHRGLAYLRQKEYDKAIIDNTKAIELKSNEVAAYNNRAFSNESKGEYSKAIEDYEKALSIDKDYTIAKKNLEFAIQKRNDQEAQKPKEITTEDLKKKEKIEKDIQQVIDKIKTAAISTVKTVVHYTKVFVADIYVSKKGTKMQYSNAIYMNDPMEGQIFFDYLKGGSKDNYIEQAYRNGERRTETSVYLGSFMPIDEREDTVDQLVMWRTYGKDEKGNEAAGCSVVLDSDFFRTKTAASEKLDSNSGMVSEDLLSVIYIKKNKDRLEINEKLKEQITPALDKLKEHLDMLIALGRHYEETNKDFFRDIENSIFTSLSKISYLFKSADYEFENEVRVINYIDREKHHDAVKYRTIENGPTNAPKKRFYIESKHDILPFIKSIYLGPKVENYQQWSLYFDYEIRERAKEFKEAATNEPNKKVPYEIKAKTIEVIKSKCSFQ